MFRYALGIVAALGLATLAPAAPAPENLEKKPKESRSQQLRKRLSEMLVDFRGIDPSTPLKDALEFIADRWEVPILIDTKAFEMIGVQKAEEQAATLPQMKGVNIRTILRGLAVQIKGDEAVGTILVQNGSVIFTTTLHADPKAWAENRKLAPTVDREFDRLALDEALHDLYDETGISIVVDVRVGEKARKAVTARLANVPLDTAVRVLADMADLQAVALENMIYVTSKENAKALLEQDKAVNPFIGPMKDKEKKEKE